MSTERGALREWVHEGGCAVTTNGVEFRVALSGDARISATFPAEQGVSVGINLDTRGIARVISVVLEPGEVVRAMVQVIAVNMSSPREKPEVYEWECFPVIERAA